MGTVISNFKEKYALALGSRKWVLRAGEIARYSGQGVIKVDFKRASENDPWEATPEAVDLIGVSGYEPSTGTYTAAWIGPDGKTESARLTPEGYSFNLHELCNECFRILPMSQHMQMSEAVATWKYWKTLWDTRDSMNPSDFVGPLSSEKSLRQQYITLLVNTDIKGGLGVGLCEARIYGFSGFNHGDSGVTIGVRLFDGSRLSLTIDDTGKPFVVEVSGTLIGEGKLINVTA